MAAGRLRPVQPAAAIASLGLPELCITGGLLVLDALVLRQYVQAKAFLRGSVAYYGAAISWHVAGAVLTLAAGALGLLLLPHPAVFAVQGLAAALICGPTAIALAPLAAGHVAATGPGYATAGALWSAAGLRLLARPRSTRRAFQLQLYGHTFAVVRVALWARRRLGLPGEADAAAYTTTAFAAFLGTVIASWGSAGALAGLALLALALLLQRRSWTLLALTY
eukprot:SM000031S11608  [mRNA]  locus=s31:591906:593282:- [translate_table: standard]